MAQIVEAKATCEECEVWSARTGLNDQEKFTRFIETVISQIQHTKDHEDDQYVRLDIRWVGPRK